MSSLTSAGTFPSVSCSVLNYLTAGSEVHRQLRYAGFNQFDRVTGSMSRPQKVQVNTGNRPANSLEMMHITAPLDQQCISLNELYCRSFNLGLVANTCAE